jgi:hypothetical protein
MHTITVALQESWENRTKSNRPVPVEASKILPIISPFHGAKHQLEVGTVLEKY